MPARGFRGLLRPAKGPFGAHTHRLVPESVRRAVRSIEDEMKRRGMVFVRGRRPRVRRRRKG